MRVEVIERKMLKDILNLDNIHSIVLIQHNMCDRTKKSLAIALKGSNRIHFLNDQVYCGSAYFISLDKYTYTFPYYVALPREYFEYVQIVRYRITEGADTPNGTHEYTRARILKKVIW